MTTDTALTGQQALEALQPLGFEVDRVTDKVYVKRGAMKLTLPKGDEQCNSTLTRIVHGIVEDLTERAIRTGAVKRRSGLPLMMDYRSVVYAVVEDRHTKWQLKDLDDGHMFEANKSECREYEPEPLPKAPPPPEPETPPEPVYTPMTNFSDRAAMHRQVRRYVEGLKVEYEQIEGKAATIRQRVAPALMFLESLGEDISELQFSPLPTLEPKRTILPPSDAPKKRGGARSSGKYSTTGQEELKGRLKMAFIDSHRDNSYGYLGRLKDVVEKGGYEIKVADAVLYKLMKEIKEELNAG